MNVVDGGRAMAKKPAKKVSAAKSKKSGKVRDLPAKSLGAKKAASVKGGASNVYLKIEGTAHKDLSTVKVAPSGINLGKF
jgi:hypothetical protein